jgi:hypothetical protein
VGALAEDSPTAAARQLMDDVNRPTGLLVPLYLYPADVHMNATFNRVIDLKLAHPAVPICVIANPNSGPGKGDLDANYIKAIDRMCGAGIYVVGYVSTEYGKRNDADVKFDIEEWRRRYPRASGIFLDEMANTVDEKADFSKRYAELTEYCHSKGYWPVFANPGTDTPQAFFEAKSADVFCIHEAGEYPKEERLKGDYFGGYSDYPPHTRSVLVYGQKNFDREKFRMISKYSRWVYVTHDTFDSKQDNPWDSLSTHMEAMLEALEGR